MAARRSPPRRATERGEENHDPRMLKLILADNQAIFRAGAAKVLAVEDEMRVVAQAHDYEQTVMALEKFRANVLVFSLGLHPSFPKSSPMPPASTPDWCWWWRTARIRRASPRMACTASSFATSPEAR